MAPDAGLSLATIQAALEAVKRTLDRLTASGQDEAAFEIARAQFAASMRASWPGNLSGLAATLDRLLGEGKVALSDEERSELRRAADVFRAVPHP